MLNIDRLKSNIFFFLLLTIHFQFFAQEKKTNWVILPNPNFGGNIVGFETSQTDSNTVYIGIANEFRFYIENIPVQSQYILFGNEKVNVIESWIPVKTLGVNKGIKTGEDRTLDEAAFMKIYNPEKEILSERFIDTSLNYHWEKEYVIQAYEVGEIPVTICFRLKNTDTLFKINTLNLIVKNKPDPSIDSLKTFQDLLKTNALTCVYDADFKEGRNLFNVSDYSFSAFNKKGKLLFKQDCYGADFTPELKKCVESEEISKIRFENIRSRAYLYKDFEVIR
jgi:hypothetical protein